MAIYAIGDLHLSVAAKKPMDIFSGWDNHADKLQENWNKKIKADDTVILAGDTSWGMSLPQAVPDFRLIHNLPGQKIILKGNHDYWWSSLTKMNTVLEEHGLTNIRFLHNNSYFVEGLHLCGSRGWILKAASPMTEIRREALRIEASLKSRVLSREKRFCFSTIPLCLPDRHWNPFWRSCTGTAFAAVTMGISTVRPTNTPYRARCGASIFI